MQENLGPGRIPILYANSSHPDDDDPDDDWDKPVADSTHYIAFDFNVVRCAYMCESACSI